MNTLVTPQKVARDIAKLIGKHARRLPENQRRRFIRHCCQYLRAL